MTTMTQPTSSRLLTADQEVDLARCIEAGVFAEELLDAGPVPGSLQASSIELELLIEQGRAAWQQMWQANVRLAWMLASKAHRGYGGSLDDLKQEAQIGLADALMRWDHTRGVKFSTHAWRWISWRLSEATRSQGRLLRELSSEDEPLEPVDPQAEAELHSWEEQQLPGWLWHLDRADRELLESRFGVEQKSPEQLAAEFGVSVTTVRRAERRALDRAREVWDTMAG